MSWLHPIINGLTACCFGAMAFTFWRSLAQEMKRGKVEDLHKQVAGIVAFSSIAFTGLWEAIAPPKPDSMGEYL